MALVFAAIAPHGSLAIAEWCKPEERDLAAKTRAAMEELGRRFAAAMPDVTVALMLHGAIADGWRGDFLSYEAPTYFGMLCAAYSPRK